MQPDDFIDGEHVLSGLQDSTPPAFETVARGAFSFGLEAGAAVGKQQEAGGAQWTRPE